MLNFPQPLVPIKFNKQEAQLSQRDRATLRFI